ncbi:MAG: phosphate acyltransferase PlsX [Holosporales bacterium]|jgi:glycerol-3-phosphate acyltransferase PlsX|nr:phosphate acyltransferase PlsX [Holosporales bacterium]
MKIAIDVMGGDLGAVATISGIYRYALENDCSGIFFELFGNEKIITSRITDLGRSTAFSYGIHDTADNVVLGSEKPTHALKNSRGTSMFEAVSHVANGKSDAVISSGNTGAYMALSKMLIGTIEGIDRPAIVSVFPNLNGKTIMLDLGANTDCSSTKLIQFAFMGQAVAKVLLRLNNPRIGLLNIGTERSKGTSSLEEAYNFLEKSNNVNFIGFVEGTDITSGAVDIIVTDGFSGNVALKSMEGTLRYIVNFLKDGFRSSAFSKVGYFLCKKIFGSLTNTIDPMRNNGAPFVGLKKISIKSHGNSDGIGFATAISVAVRLARSEFIKNIEEMISKADEKDSNESKSC